VRVQAGGIFGKKHGSPSTVLLPGLFSSPHVLVVGEAMSETEEEEEDEYEFEYMPIKCRRLLSFTPEGAAEFAGH